MSEVQKYIQKLQREEKKVLEEIAIKERTLSRIRVKLSDPEFHLAKELNRGAVKVSKLMGKEVAQKNKTVLKRNKAEVEKVEIPTVEMELSGPAAAAGEDKKSKGTFF
jgi:DNA-directed RNA polymerase subunit H (RpoH/RPB5)